MANQSVASGILTDYNGNPFLPRTVISQVFDASTGMSLTDYVWPVKNGGTGRSSLDSGKALIGNGTNDVSLRSITNNTTATAVTASTNLITANTLYYHKGNSNIVNVGTITSGTWQGTDVGLSYGGTGVSLSNNPSMLVNLGSTTAGAVFADSPRPGVTGTLAIGNGGTGATTAAEALTNLGLTATAAELNVLDGITATTTELNYVDGVTSNIQTQLNRKSPSNHNHDSRYYTETEIGTIPSGYSTLVAYINSKTSGTATSGDLAALKTRVGNLEGKSLLVNLGSTSAVALSNVNQNIGIKGTLPVSNGGTGATSATANRILYFTNNALTASNHYMNASKLAINSTTAPSYNLYINGSTCLNGRMVLRNSIYGSLDDMNAITNPEEGQVFFVLN